MDFQKDWQKACAIVGSAAALMIVVNLMKKSSSSTDKKSKTATSGGDAHAPAVLVKNPNEIVNYIRDNGDKMAIVPEKAMDNIGDLGKFMAFKGEYKTRFCARPDVTEGELVKVTDWYRLTPVDYDRTTFHFEIDITGTSMEHTLNGSQGKALSVYATNDPDMVTKFLAAMKIDPHEIVSIEEIAPPEEENTAVLTSMEKLFMQYLDLFGKPTREFLKKLFPYAIDVQEKVAIAELTLERKMEEFQDRQARAYTFADYLTEFPSLKIPADKWTDLIPTIKQRVYSICSSSDYRPGKCQLLVVREDWQAKGEGTKWPAWPKKSDPKSTHVDPVGTAYGHCSSFLSFSRPGQYVIAHSTHSVMQMPEDPMVHIFMAGLGTGLAPFRAYIEQRKWQKSSQGLKKVGPMTLFFGGRYSKAEYYYKDEFDAFEAEGIVKCCNAWSRDQKQKVYVQHKIKEEAEDIWNQLGAEGSTGYFFLCGSKQPEKDVFKAILEIFQEKGKMTDKQAMEKMESLQQCGRYVTEVY